MKQPYIYQLAFPTQQTWEQWKADNAEIEGIINAVELGNDTEGGTWDENGEVIEPPTQLDTYLVDIKSWVLLSDLQQYVINPKNPQHGQRWKANCVVVEPTE